VRIRFVKLKFIPSIFNIQFFNIQLCLNRVFVQALNMNVSWSFDPKKYPQTTCAGLLHDTLHLRIGSQEVGKSFFLVTSVRQESMATKFHNSVHINEC